MKTQARFFQCAWRVLLVALLASLAGQARAVPIRVTYTDGGSEGFNDPTLGSARRLAFEAAAAVWSQRLAGSVPIEIRASFDPLGGDAERATLGSAGPDSIFANWSGTTAPPQSDTYYVVGLANNLAGGDLDPGNADIVARFNSDLDGPAVFGDSSFYYGLDARPPQGDVDFFPVVLHELGHGLGFTGLFDSSGATDSNAFTSFDRLIATGPAANAPLLHDYTNRQERQALLVSNSLYFAGPRARAAGGGRNAKLYAPADFTQGSSLYHTDEATYTGAEELMTPLATGNPHTPGPITLAMFLDVGWGALSASPAPTPTASPTATPPPAVSRPANDNFANAQAIGGASGRVAGRNTNATKESGEPNHVSLGGASVWYRWAPPSSGTATVATAGSTFDTLLAVYTGGSVSGLARVAQNDDVSEADRTSRVSFGVVVGRTYWVAVDGYSAEQGAVSLSWSLSSAPVGPANNDFARAQVLAGVSGRVAGTTVNANLQASEPRFGGPGRTVWYRWAAPRAGRWTFTTQGSAPDTVLGLFTGAAVSSARLLAYDDDDAPLRTSSVTVALAAGAVAYVAVDSKGGTGAPFTLSFGAAPANDDAQAAQVLVGARGGVRASTDFASRQVGEQAHAGTVGNRSVWFRWVAPSGGQATWRTTGSTFDTLLAVYVGTPLSALSRVASADNDTGVLTGTVTFTVAEGTTYWIAVDGKNATSGALALAWSLLAAPSNDQFARATAISGLSGTLTATNLAATGEVGEPRHAGLGSGRAVWFRWVAPATGRATVVAFSPYFRPVVVGYQGTAANALRSVALFKSADERNFTITMSMVQGQEYWLAVDSYNLGAATAQAAFILRWNLAPSSPVAAAPRVRASGRLAAWIP